MDYHPCIVEVGHKRPHFLTLVVIDGFGPWEHLLNRRGYVELVPVVITFSEKSHQAQFMHLEAMQQQSNVEAKRATASELF